MANIIECIEVGSYNEYMERKTQEGGEPTFEEYSAQLAQVREETQVLLSTMGGFSFGGVVYGAPETPAIKAPIE